MPTIRFTNRLNRHVNCPTSTVQGATVLEVLHAYFDTNNQVKGYVLDECDSLRQHMAIFIDGEPITNRRNLHQPIDESSIVDVIQALTGG